MSTQTRNNSSQKLVNKFTYLGSSVSSTETDINTWLAKAGTALTDKIKCNFFQAAVMLILLYGCTTWTLTKHMEKKLDSNYTRLLWVILNKSWRQYSTKQQLYGHLPPIMKTIQVWWTRHVVHCRRSRNELISDKLLWTPSHGQAKVGRPDRTYVQQLCANTRYSLADLSGAMDDREGWRERVREVRVDGMMMMIIMS